MLLKNEIIKIFEKPKPSEETIGNTNSEEVKTEWKEYPIKEIDGNIYVEVEKDKYILEFYNLGSLIYQNGENIHLYTVHMIDIENNLYGRYKLDSKKLEDIICKDNFSFLNYSEHNEIVNSYKHFK